MRLLFSSFLSKQNIILRKCCCFVALRFRFAKKYNDHNLFAFSRAIKSPRSLSFLFRSVPFPLFQLSQWRFSHNQFNRSSDKNKLARAKFLLRHQRRLAHQAESGEGSLKDQQILPKVDDPSSYLGRKINLFHLSNSHMNFQAASLYARSDAR